MSPKVPRTAGHLLLQAQPALEGQEQPKTWSSNPASRRPAGWGCGEWTMDGPRPDLETGCRQEGGAPPARRAATPSEARNCNDRQSRTQRGNKHRQEGGAARSEENTTAL